MFAAAQSSLPISIADSAIELRSFVSCVAGAVVALASTARAGAAADALRREPMLFGIDVVIIEPGTVNTAMYDKGEKEDLSEFEQTEYWQAVQRFQQYIVNEARTNGLSPECLGQAVHVALSTGKTEGTLRSHSTAFQEPYSPGSRGASRIQKKSRLPLEVSRCRTGDTTSSR